MAPALSKNKKNKSLHGNESNDKEGATERKRKRRESFYSHIVIKRPRHNTKDAHGKRRSSDISKEFNVPPQTKRIIYRLFRIITERKKNETKKRESKKSKYIHKKREENKNHERDGEKYKHTHILYIVCRGYIFFFFHYVCMHCAQSDVPPNKWRMKERVLMMIITKSKMYFLLRRRRRRRRRRGRLRLRRRFSCSYHSALSLVKTCSYC